MKILKPNILPLNLIEQNHQIISDRQSDIDPTKIELILNYSMTQSQTNQLKTL